MPRIGDMKVSKFLKRSDLGEDDERMFTITGVSEENAGTADQEDIKWALLFKEIDKPMILNWTNMQLLEKVTGSDNTDDWTGKRVLVWFDESVQFKGEMKGGLRIKRAPKGRETKAKEREPGEDDDTSGDGVPWDTD
jgi:hypothetical protein